MMFDSTCADLTSQGSHHFHVASFLCSVNLSQRPVVIWKIELIGGAMKQPVAFNNSGSLSERDCSLAC